MLSHTYERVVHWGECDPARILFFPTYFRWMEEGYAYMLRAAGVSVTKTVAPGRLSGTPAVALKVKFAAPARLGATVRHEVEVVDLGVKSFTMRHRVFEGETLLMEASDTRVWCEIATDETGAIAPLAIPQDIAARLKGAG